jgi:hypothetical protein
MTQYAGLNMIFSIQFLSFPFNRKGCFYFTFT